MDEDICSVFSRDESKALLGVEELHGSLWHRVASISFCTSTRLISYPLDPRGQRTRKECHGKIFSSGAEFVDPQLSELRTFPNTVTERFAATISLVLVVWSQPCFGCARTSGGRLTRTSVHHHYQLKTKPNLGTQKRKRKWEHRSASGSGNTEAEAEVESTRKGLAERVRGTLVLATNGVNRFGSFWDRPPSGGLSASEHHSTILMVGAPRALLASAGPLGVPAVDAIDLRRP